MLTNAIHTDFLDLFYSEIKDQALENGNKLNVFTLRVINNSFAYHELIDLLGDKLHHFALSRKEIQHLMDQDKLRTLVGRFGDMLHPIPWQTDHPFCWQRNATNALTA